MSISLSKEVQPTSHAHKIGVLGVMLPSVAIISTLLFNLPSASQQLSGALLPAKKAAVKVVYSCPTVVLDEAAKIEEPDVALKEAHAIVMGNSQSVAAKDSTTTRQQLIERKKDFLGLVAKDPKAALSYVMPKATAQQYATWTKNCVEGYQTVTGVVTEFAVSPIEGSEDAVLQPTFYQLRTTSGSTYTLHIANDLHTAIPTGTTVEVRGYALDKELLVDGLYDIAEVPAAPAGDDAPTGYTIKSAATDQEPVSGPQQTIVLLANFQNTTQPPLTVSAAQNIVFSQMQSYYQQNSYNSISIVGNVENWRTIPMDATCDTSSSLAPIIQAFDSSVDFSQYERLVVFAPFGPGCPFVGMSSVGQLTVTTNDGPVVMSTSYVLSNYAGVSIAAHEYGHGLGLHHASFYNCPNVPYQETGCSITEYGDPYSVMGNHALMGYFNALEKDYLGWFVPSNMQTITQSGTYTIDHLEVSSSNLKALKIQRATNDYLYAEFRQPLNHDANFVGTNVYDGALLHVRANTDTAGPKANRSFLLDAQHTTMWGSANDAALTPGQTFIDPLTNTSIKTLAKGDGDLTLQVQIGKHDFDKPQVAFTSPANGADVDGTFTVTVNAQDPSGIEKVTLSTGFFKAPLGTDTEAPYEFTIDSSMLPSGSNTLVATAFDNAGTPFGVANNSASTGFMDMTVNVIGGDTQPPVVSLVSPVNDSAVPNDVTFAAEATDNGFMNTLEIYVDGVKKFFVIRAFGDPSTLSGVLNLSEGQHTAYVRGVDVAGTVGQSDTITFVVDDTNPTVTLLSPTDGQTVGGPSVALEAEASDNDAIDYVDFYFDNDVRIGHVEDMPYQMFWNTVPLGPGPHTIVAKAFDRAGHVAVSEIHDITIGLNPTPICGDASGDGMVTVSDVVYLINYIFSGGPAPAPLGYSDADGNNLVNISDAVFLIDYIFAEGRDPQCPPQFSEVQESVNPTEGMTLDSFKAAHQDIFGQ